MYRHKDTLTIKAKEKERKEKQAKIYFPNRHESPLAATYTCRNDAKRNNRKSTPQKRFHSFPKPVRRNKLISPFDEGPLLLGFNSSIHGLVVWISLIPLCTGRTIRIIRSPRNRSELERDRKIGTRTIIEDSKGRMLLSRGSKLEGLLSLARSRLAISISMGTIARSRWMSGRAELGGRT